MKLSDLRVCDSCHKVLAPHGIFYVAKVSMAMVDPKKANQTLGLSMMLGNSLELAEIMGSDPEAVTVMGEKDSSLMATVLLCQDCYMSKQVLAMAVETAIHAEEHKPEL